MKACTASSIDRENAKKVGALYTELTRNITVLESPASIVNEHSWSLEHDCLNLLLMTFYIDLGPEALRKAFEYRAQLRILQTITVTPDLIANALRLSKELAQMCFDVRKRILLGMYEEPEELSTMIWKAPAMGSLESRFLADIAMCRSDDIDRRLLNMRCAPGLTGRGNPGAPNTSVTEARVIDSEGSTSSERKLGQPRAAGNKDRGRRRS